MFHPTGSRTQWFHEMELKDEKILAVLFSRVLFLEQLLLKSGLETFPVSGGRSDPKVREDESEQTTAAGRGDPGPI